MKRTAISLSLIGALSFACGGASNVDSGRDPGGSSDSLESDDADEPSGDETDPDDVGESGTEDSAENDAEGEDPADGAPEDEPTDPVDAATQVIAQQPPAAATPPATAPAPQPTTPTEDTEIPAIPVDPNTWLYHTDEVDDDSAFARDAGVPEELRVDDLTILVIFDNSGSMDTYWDGGTRWEAANRALVQAIQPVQTSLKAGAIRFPLETSCGVPAFDVGAQIGFSLGEEFLATWINSALAPQGGTPLAQAFLVADEAIANAGEMELLEDRFRVVVLTDGEPNCDGDDALLTELPSKWLERGVETMVLGLPGSSQAAALLDAIAEAGGTHAHHSLGTIEELDETVTQAAR